MVSAWPEYKDELHFAAEEAQMESLMDAVRAIRNRRAEMNVPPSKKAKVDVYKRQIQMNLTIDKDKAVELPSDLAIEDKWIISKFNTLVSMRSACSVIWNRCCYGNRFTVIIIRDDTGEEIYRSGYLDPEQYIDETELDVVLPQGEYSCSAYFDAYRVKDSSYIGRAAAQITLYVFQ